MYNVTQRKVLHNDERMMTSSNGNIHRSPVYSLHKGQWRRALMFPFSFAWLNGWANDIEAGDLRHHRAHYDVTVVWIRNFLITLGAAIVNICMCRLIYSISRQSQCHIYYNTAQHSGWCPRPKIRQIVNMTEAILRYSAHRRCKPQRSGNRKRLSIYIYIYKYIQCFIKYSKY